MFGFFKKKKTGIEILAKFSHGQCQALLCESVALTFSNGSLERFCEQTVARKGFSGQDAAAMMIVPIFMASEASDPRAILADVIDNENNGFCHSSAVLNACGKYIKANNTMVDLLDTLGDMINSGRVSPITIQTNMFEIALQIKWV